MAIDLKYGRVTAEKGDRVHGEPGIPLNESDEPCFVLRAQDVTSIPVLQEYKRQSWNMKATQEHIDSIDKVIRRFAAWQVDHSNLVKIPD